jgi:hypothetical protein
VSLPELMVWTSAGSGPMPSGPKRSGSFERMMQ